MIDGWYYYSESNISIEFEIIINHRRVAAAMRVTLVGYIILQWHEYWIFLLGLSGMRIELLEVSAMLVSCLIFNIHSLIEYSMDIGYGGDWEH